MSLPKTLLACLILFWVVSPRLDASDLARSYLIDSSGNVLSSFSGRYYEADDDLENYWVLDDQANQVRMIGSYDQGFRSLATNDFSVADITDITWSSQDRSWVVAKGRSHFLRSDGSVSASIDGRYYEADDDVENYWQLDADQNQFRQGGGGVFGTGWRSLNTTAFSISDVSDVTWSAPDRSWMVVDGQSYLVRGDGDILATNPGRYYEADDDTESYWYLDSDQNTIRQVGPYDQGNQVLRTNEFSVAQITDITWSRDSRAWVTVKPVPAPLGLVGLVAVGIGCYAFRRERFGTRGDRAELPGR
ncbi:MAG: hypothetical protein AAGD07_17010 [Planctomycetota bacterium]